MKDADKNRAVDLGRQLVSLGFVLFSTSGTAKVLAENGVPVTRIPRLEEGRPNVIDMIKNGRMQLIINTPSGMMPRQDENKIRTAAVLNNISIMTTMAGAFAALRGIKAMKQKRVGVRSLQSYVGNVY